MSEQHSDLPIDHGAPGVQQRVATLEDRLQALEAQGTPADLYAPLERRLAALELSTAPERMQAAAERLDALAADARAMIEKAREALAAPRPATFAVTDATPALIAIHDLLEKIMPNDTGALHRLLHPEHSGSSRG
jgi:hypothetical protein